MGTVHYAALASTQDALTGTGVFPATLPGKALDAAQAAAMAGPALGRLRALSPAWRAAVLDGVLAETVRVRADETGAHLHARVAKDKGAALADAFAEAPFAWLTPSPVAMLGEGLGLIASYSVLRAERLAEIEVQLHDLISFFAAIDAIDAARTPWVMEVLRAALRFSDPLIHRVKFAFSLPRPVHLSDRIQPMIATPTHGTLPSGHATQAYLLATVLTRLAGQDPQDGLRAISRRYALAARIAINRTVAGVHFAADNAAGAALGLALGEHLAACGTGRAGSRWGFDGRQHGGETDFHAGTMAETGDRAATDPALPHGEGQAVGWAPGADAPAADALFGALWAAAAAEMESATRWRRAAKMAP